MALDTHARGVKWGKGKRRPSRALPSGAVGIITTNSSIHVCKCVIPTVTVR